MRANESPATERVLRGQEDGEAAVPPQRCRAGRGCPAGLRRATGRRGRRVTGGWRLPGPPRGPCGSPPGHPGTRPGPHRRRAAPASSGTGRGARDVLRPPVPHRVGQGYPDEHGRHGPGRVTGHGELRRGGRRRPAGVPPPPGPPARRGPRRGLSPSSRYDRVSRPSRDRNSTRSPVTNAAIGGRSCVPTMARELRRHLPGGSGAPSGAPLEPEHRRGRHPPVGQVLPDIRLHRPQSSPMASARAATDWPASTPTMAWCHLHVGALVRGHPGRHPPQPEQAHQIILSRAGRLRAAGPRASRSASGAYPWLAKPLRMLGLLDPALLGAGVNSPAGRPR